MARHISWSTRFLATPGSNPGTVTTFQPFRSRFPLSPYFLHRRDLRCRILSRSRPSVESLVRIVGAVRLDRNDAWLRARNFMGRPQPAEGQRVARVAAAGEGAVGRVLTLAEAAFMNKHGRAA